MAKPDPTTMTSYFLLFAGLTSLRSNLCFSHFWSSGPEGMFASNCIGAATVHADSGRVEDLWGETTWLQSASDDLTLTCTFAEPHRSAHR